MRGPAALVRRQFPVIALAVIGVTYVGLAFFLAWEKAQDDAAITFAYAKNLVHGHGLVLSAGAEPVEGYSNFLWLLVNAPAIAAGWDAINTAKALGIVFGLGTLGLLARIPGQVEGRRLRELDLIAPALTAVSVPFALWSMSGLENSLQAFLIILAVSLTIREVNEPQATPWSSIALFALALSRPEGVVYWIVAVVHRAALIALAGRRSRQDILWAFGFIAPFFAYHVWHFAYFGELVPNTYFVKADHRSIAELFSYATNSSDHGFVYLRSFFGDYWLLPFLLLVPLSLLGLRGLVQYSLPVTMLSAGLVVILYEGGDWMPHYRFMSPLIPLLFLAAQEGGRNLIQLSHRWRPGLPLVAINVAVALAVLAVAVSASATRMGEVHASPFHGEYTLVKAVAHQVENLAKRIGKERASVLAPDIGALAYDTNLFVIDLGGLADATIARHPRGPELMDYVFEERRPDIITTHEPWVKDLDKDWRLEHDYAPVGAAYDSEGNLIGGTFVRRELVLVQGSCPDAIRWDAAEAHIGERATVRGPVVSGGIDPIAGHIGLHVGELGAFVIGIQRPDRQNFVIQPEVAYVGETVCVTGEIQSYLGLPIMRAEAPQDILVERP